MASVKFSYTYTEYKGAPIATKLDQWMHRPSQIDYLVTIFIGFVLLVCSGLCYAFFNGSERTLLKAGAIISGIAMFFDFVFAFGGIFIIKGLAKKFELSKKMAVWELNRAENSEMPKYPPEIRKFTRTIVWIVLGINLLPAILVAAAKIILKF